MVQPARKALEVADGRQGVDGAQGPVGPARPQGPKGEKAILVQLAVKVLTVHRVLWSQLVLEFGKVRKGTLVHVVRSRPAKAQQVVQQICRPRDVVFRNSTGKDTLGYGYTTEQ